MPSGIVSGQNLMGFVTCHDADKDRLDPNCPGFVYRYNADQVVPRRIYKVLTFHEFSYCRSALFRDDYVVNFICQNYLEQYCAGPVIVVWKMERDEIVEVSNKHLLRFWLRYVAPLAINSSLERKKQSVCYFGYLDKRPILLPCPRSTLHQCYYFVLYGAI